MDNIGYQNWSTSDLHEQSISSSEAGSPPTYGRSRRRDDYSFELKDDDSDYNFRAGKSGAAVRSGSFEKREVPVRRMSTDERMKEILSRNQILTTEKSTTVVPEKGDDAWMRMRESIMEGVSATQSSAQVPTQKYSATAVQDTSLNSNGLDTSDSLELSATDLEVGAYAARRSQEKTTERLRRQSINEEALMRNRTAGTKSLEYPEKSSSETGIPERTKVDESPNVRRAARRTSYNTTSTHIPGFQMSTALSSIEHGERRELPSSVSLGDEGGGGLVRYGSEEKSDGELYDILSRVPSVTGSINSSMASNNAFSANREVHRSLKSVEGYSDDDFEASEDSKRAEPAAATDDKELEDRRRIEAIQTRWSNPERVLKGLIAKQNPDTSAEQSIVSMDNIAAPSIPTRSEVPARYASSEEDSSNLSQTKDESISNRVTLPITQVSDDRDADFGVRMSSNGSSQSAIVLQASYSRATESSTSSGDQQKDLVLEEAMQLLEEAVDSFSEAIQEPSDPQIKAFPVDESITQKVPSRFIDMREKTGDVISSHAAAQYNFPRPSEDMPLDLPVWETVDNDSQSDKSGDEDDVFEPEREDAENMQVIYYSNDAHVIKKQGTADVSLSSKFRKSQNQKPSPARVPRTSTKASASDKEPHGPPVIRAEEINPAFFGYAPDVETENDADVKKKAKPSGPSSIPTLPPNIDELRANLKAHLKFIPGAKKRKTSPVKSAAHSVPAKSDKQSVLRRPSPSTNTTSSSTRAQPQDRYGKAPEFASKVPSKSHEQLQLKQESAPTMTRSQSPRPMPFPIGDTGVSSTPQRNEESNSRWMQKIQDLEQQIASLHRMDSAAMQSQLSQKAAQQKQASNLAMLLPSNSVSDDVLIKMVETLRESNQLSLREVAVREREKAIVDREKSVLSAQAKRIQGDFFGEQDAQLASVAMKEKEQEWIFREQKLLDEIADLKSNLFRLQNDNESSSRRFPVPVEDIVDGKGTVGGDVESKSETVTIPRYQYEEMKKDIIFQESLISGFKTENDKLVAQIKQRESEESQRAAKFYDKEEKMNKELNRLRNIAGIDPVTDITDATGLRISNVHGKSEVFSSLRADLEKDTYIEHLREKLQDEQVEHSKRIKELQGTIEKLRVENKRLDASSKASAMLTMELMELKSSAISSQTEKRKLNEEIDRLKEKLRWYSENQQLLETADSEKLELRNTIMSLKKEVQHLKSQLSATSDTSLGALLKPSSALDSSYSSRVRGKSVVRDPNDIKKIEDLKEALREMQESINKRYPDSVATLIQASKLSDSVQAKHDDTEKNLKDAKEELLKARQEFERRLRSLRQEHEKVKLQYEERIKNLQATAGAPKTEKTEGTARNLPAANLKIKELEKEIERLRVFYTKKVEETQRKADAQLRSLKRGDKGDVLDSVSELPEAIVQQYETRISLLEKELLATAEELGLAKATATASATEIKLLQQAAIPLPASPSAAFTTDANNMLPLPPPPPLPSPAVVLNASGPVDFSAVLESQRLAKDDSDNQLQTIINLNTKVAEIMTELNAARLDLAEQKSRVAMLLSEKDSSQAQLDSIRSELHAKQLEIANHLRDASSNSQSLQLASVERQVKVLEDKIFRREEELQAMIEETRAAAKIERSRLKSIHEQELFEKDDQLRKFQYQLEDLVEALRKQSLVVNMGSSSLSTVLTS